jgi:hypothetical protein
MRRRSFLAVLAIALAACSSSPNIPPCDASPTQPSNTGFPEVRGTMRSAGEMWSLLFFDVSTAGEDEKIAWRITGDGTEFEAIATRQGGTSIRPVWGPDYHGGGSNWDWPGDEWATGFNFPEPGCWTIRAARGTTRSEIRLNVTTP